MNVLQIGQCPIILVMLGKIDRGMAYLLDSMDSSRTIVIYPEPSESPF